MHLSKHACLHGNKQIKYICQQTHCAECVCGGWFITPHLPRLRLTRPGVGGRRAAHQYLSLSLFLPLSLSLSLPLSLCFLLCLSLAEYVRRQSYVLP